MAELKTKKTELSVSEFIQSVPDKTKQEDSFRLVEMMKKVTGAEPKMWGGSIIGFGDEHLKYESGRELDWFTMGFSPRKAALSIYAMGAEGKYDDVLKRLGKYKMGKGCLYINKLADVDEKVLMELLKLKAKKS